jgi:O-methyltransferase
LRGLPAETPTLNQLLRRVGRRIPGLRRLRLALAFWREAKLPASEAWRLSAVSGFTLIAPARLLTLHRLARELIGSGIPGCFVECGSWAGGSGAVLGAAAADDPERMLWMFDSWEGVPPPSEYDISAEGAPGRAGAWSASRHQAEAAAFEVMELDRNRVRMVEGWFDRTLPEQAEAMGEIALLHIDADWYESVKLCLDELYAKVVAGGVVVIDDYGTWQGCKKAVDEFVSGRPEALELVPVDAHGVYFRKPGTSAGL